MSETRERIVAAAVDITKEDSQKRASVRAVAARAGVGASTLRYYFPTQRDLLVAVMQKTFEEQYPDERIHDSSIPAKARLLECLSNLLVPIGEGEQAREFWTQLFSGFAAAAQNAPLQSVFSNIDHVSGSRVESWLEVLEAEGAVPPGGRAHRALFLLTVVDGLAVARAVPGGSLDRAGEARILEDAVDAIMRE